MVKIDVNDFGDYYIVVDNEKELSISSEEIREKKVKLVSLKNVTCDFDFCSIVALKRVNIFDSDFRKCSDINLDSLYTTVERLNLVDSYFSKEFDFSNLENLITLELNWINSYRCLNLPHLKSLVIRKLNVEALPIEDVRELEILEVIRGNIASLRGFEHLKSLKALTLYQTKNLPSNELSKLSSLPLLEYIHIYGYHSCINLDQILVLPQIKWIVIENCSDLRLSDNLKISNSVRGINIVGKNNLPKASVKILDSYTDCKYGYIYGYDH